MLDNRRADHLYLSTGLSSRICTGGHKEMSSILADNSALEYETKRGGGVRGLSQ
jgi:hypothetical protein